MSETPRTDALIERLYGHTTKELGQGRMDALYDFARELERESARLRALLVRTQITLTVLKGKFGEHTEARAMMEERIRSIADELKERP